MTLVIDAPPVIPPVVMQSAYTPSPKSRETRLRLTPDQFGNVWRLVQDRRLADVLAYQMPYDTDALRCRGYVGDEIEATRVRLFIELNGIELVEEVPDAPRFEGGVFTTSLSFQVWAATRKFMNNIRASIRFREAQPC